MRAEAPAKDLPPVIDANNRTSTYERRDCEQNVLLKALPNSLRYSFHM
jgi:hypothetical protein